LGVQQSGRLWRSTAFATPEGHGRVRLHSTFGSSHWIDPVLGKLLAFYDGAMHPSDIDIEHVRIFAPDEASLLGGLSVLYPEIEILAAIKKRLAGR